MFALCLVLSTAASLAQSPSVSTVSGGRAGTPRYGYVDGNTATDAQFHTPIGLALDSFGFNGSGPLLYVADRDNNAVRKLDLNLNQTITFATNVINRISQPVGVAVDAGGTLYVLNRGNGANGTVLSFNRFGNFLGTNAASLSAAEGIALDGGGNIYVTVNSNSVVQIYPGSYPGAQTSLKTIANPGAWLRGLTVRQDGTVAVCDAGRHGILVINPGTGGVTNLAGFNGAGDQFGIAANNQFNQPYGVAAAGNGMLVVTDNGNHRVKVIDPQGTACNLYGVCSNNWVVAPGDPSVFPGWFDGNGCPCEITCQICDQYAEARLPAGLVVAPSGDVYTTEDYYHLIRLTTGTGLTGFSGGGGSGTNVATVTAPTILSPVSGYYPMGQLVLVSSPNPTVYYTTDGSEPTTNSLQVAMNGNTGIIHWFNSTNDLTALAVKAFSGTNSSVTVRGQPASTNNIGVPPAPTSSGALFAGIGSAIVVPVVANLRTNDQVKSFQFRVEVAPNPPATNSILSDYRALNILSNDFIQLVTAAQGTGPGTNSFVSYTNGTTVGLEITSIGNSGNTFFQRFAAVALLKVPIPPNANQGDSYSVTVSYPSATSDGVNNPVPLTAMPAATILVTNVPYTIGDSASPFGAWYNAGGFGDGDLVNADVNNAFYAAAGLRVPYAFSDVFNAMDAYPYDASGFVGGDGQIRFLDWEVILQRSLRLDTNNWARKWSPGGNLVNNRTNLSVHPLVNSPQPLVVAPWYKQVLVGAVSVGNIPQGGQANVPVYVKLGDGSTLAGLQFRAIVTALNGSVPLAQAPQFIAAPGMPAPALQQSFQASATAFGWPLGSFSFQSRSSNFVGWLTFTLPPGTPSGGSYTVAFANADGSPDLYTQYDFETRSASVAVNALAPPASICSDEWKLHFFGSVTAPNAVDLADPDGDGVPNWMEYVAGTDPTDPNSKLRFISVDKQIVSGQPKLALHWLTAPGKAYEVQSSSVPVGTWNTLGTVSGDGSITTYTDSAGATSRFYRLRVLP